AARVPQRRAVVEIEGDDGAVPPGRGHRLDRERGGARRERGEDAAAMEPASPVATEDGVPVDVARPQHRGRGMPAVGAAERRANAEAALDEVEAVPRA